MLGLRILRGGVELGKQEVLGVGKEKKGLQNNQNYMGMEGKAEQSPSEETAKTGEKKASEVDRAQAVELEIGWIQEKLEERKNKDLKDVAEKLLEEKFGEFFMWAANVELEKLQKDRRFLQRGELRSLGHVESEGKEEKRNENKRKEYKNENEPKKENLEGEKLFQYQIENNAHPAASSLKEDMTQFIKSVDKGIVGPDDFKFLKKELSEVLYRNSIEYVENKEVIIDRENAEILQPILNFRKELDQWNTVSEPRISDLRKRILEYMGGTFGVESYAPREGEGFNGKDARAIKVEETKNEFLDGKIKKVYSPGYKINDNLASYYEEWLIKKRQEIDKKANSIKDSVSRQEFDKITDSDREWLTRHRFAKSIKPAQVEVYKYKA